MGIFKDLTPEMHCTGSIARNAQGEGVFAAQWCATQWCALGWIEKHGRLLDAQLLRAAAEVAMQVCPQIRPPGRTGFNSDVGRVSYANDGEGWRFIEALQAAGI